MEQFDLAIFGAGVAVKKALPAIKRIFPSVAICHLDAVIDEQFNSFTPFSDIDSFFKCSKVRGCYVATPVNSHFDITRSCINRGIPTLVEKPMALNSTEARKLINLDAELIAIAFKRRYSDVMLKIRQMRKGTDAPKAHLDLVWHAPPPGDDHWKINKGISGGGILYDIGSHVLDIMTFSIGDIKKISVTDFEFDPVSKTESMISANIEFVCGSTGSFLISWADNDEIQKVEYYSGASRVSWIKYGKTDKADLVAIERGRTDLSCSYTIEDYHRLFSAFYNLCVGKVSDVPGASEGLKNMQLIENVESLLKSQLGNDHAW